MNEPRTLGRDKFEPGVDTLSSSNIVIVATTTAAVASTRRYLNPPVARKQPSDCDTRHLAGALTLPGLISLTSLLFVTVAVAVTVDALVAQDPQRTIRAQTQFDDSDRGADGNALLVQTRSGLFKGVHLSARDQVGGTSPRRRIHPARDSQSEDNVVGFLGIRYASAPIKRLRFMPPTAYQYAPGRVHNAQKFGPICRQRWPTISNLDAGIDQSDESTRASGWDLQMRVMRSVIPARESQSELQSLLSRLALREQSEDCLNLNLYVPVEALTKTSGGALGIEPRPVLVIIHGEAATSDYGSGSTINGFRFANQNRLLAVTFNYRLNLLGFPPKLLGASRGNLGLMDQVAALHWIKDNINSFGGSPNNITLMGTGGQAAIFVNLLMLSPLAKGLFQRAVMEDGSALTPLVANQLITSGGGGGSSTNLQQQQAAVQHFRLLAKLCDCPMAEKSILANGAATKVQINNSPMPASSLTAADEARTNSLTFECLKQKPAELLMQPVPSDLLRLDSQTNQLTIAGRWLRLLDQQHLQDSEVPANSTLVHQLIVAASGKLSTSPVNNNQDGDQIDEMNKLAQQFLSACYGPPAKNLRPMFGPVLDGTIVPDEDVATVMLKPESAFGQRDLLIGLSQPVLAPSRTGDNQVNNDTVAMQRLSNVLTLWPQFFAGQDIEGLSNEQALDMANLFVRSFYRYHNQEIANSILNHYLLNAGRSSTARNAKLLVMNSLSNAINDALINVPLLKTSLIHATKQLEHLIEPFTSQLFARWIQQQRGQQQQQQQHVIVKPANETLEQFIAFASSLFRDPNWPLRIVTLQDQELQHDQQQPKATYLYQFNADHLIEQVKGAISAGRQQWPQTPGWQALKDVLTSFLIKIHSSQIHHKLGFGCALDYHNDNEVDSGSLVSQVVDLVCTKLGATLGNFVASGDVNKGNNPYVSQDLDINEDLQTQVERYETRCMTSPLTDGDHHSIQLRNDLTEFSISCQQELHSLASNCIFKSRTEIGQPINRWPVFSLFNQQVVTLPQLSGDFYQVSQVGSTSDTVARTANSDTEQWNFAARSSFWSNFIPALNCSRTQPVVPTALLAVGNSFGPNSAHPNSSILLNLNLQFNCHLGSKTAYSSMEHLSESINQRLQMRASSWLLEQQQQQHQRHQNHHSLRMINQTAADFDSSLPDASSQDSQQTLMNDSNAIQLLQPIPGLIHAQSDGNNQRSSEENQARAYRYPGISLLVCGLLLSATLASGAYALITRKQRASVSRRRKSQSGSTQVGNGVKCETSQTVDDQSPESTSHGFGPASGSNHGDLMLESITELDSQTEQQGVDAKVNETAIDQQQKQAAVSTLDSQQANFLYWNQAQDSNIGNNTMSLCRSHSAMSMSNGFQPTLISNNDYNSSDLQDIGARHHLSGGFVMDQTRYPSTYYTLDPGQQPIMVPLISSNGLSSTSDLRASQIYTGNQLLSMHNQESNNNLGNQLNGMTQYGDSSSETQGNQSSGSLSTLTMISNKKKRVKISDPPASSCRSSTLKRHTTYCPVHQKVRTQTYESQEFATDWQAQETQLIDNHLQISASYNSGTNQGQKQRQRQNNFHCPHQQAADYGLQ